MLLESDPKIDEYLLIKKEDDELHHMDPPVREPKPWMWASMWQKDSKFKDSLVSVIIINERPVAAVVRPAATDEWCRKQRYMAWVVDSKKPMFVESHRILDTKEAAMREATAMLCRYLTAITEKEVSMYVGGENTNRVHA
jgi:hypothetical protein